MAQLESRRGAALTQCTLYCVQSMLWSALHIPPKRHSKAGKQQDDFGATCPHLSRTKHRCLQNLKEAEAQQNPQLSIGYQRVSWISKRHCASVTRVSWHDAIGNSDLKKECCTGLHAKYGMSFGSFGLTHCRTKARQNSFEYPCNSPLAPCRWHHEGDAIFCCKS